MSQNPLNVEVLPSHGYGPVANFKRNYAYNFIRTVEQDTNLEFMSAVGLVWPMLDNSIKGRIMKLQIRTAIKWAKKYCLCGIYGK